MKNEAWEKARDGAAVEYRKDREWIKCEEASYETDFKAGADFGRAHGIEEERKRSECLLEAIRSASMNLEHLRDEHELIAAVIDELDNVLAEATGGLK